MASLGATVLQQFAAVLPSRTEVRLQNFAAVLPSRAELQPSTVRCCSPLTHRSQPFKSSLLFSPHAPKSTLQHSAAVTPQLPELSLPVFRVVLHKTPEVHPSTIPCSS